MIAPLPGDSRDIEAMNGKVAAGGRRRHDLDVESLPVPARLAASAAGHCLLWQGALPADWEAVLVPWARIDDGFDDHPKVLALLDHDDGAAALGLWVLC